MEKEKPPVLRSSSAEVVGDGDDAVQSRVEDGSSLSVDTSKAQDNTPGKKFFVFLAGKTNDAHHDFVKKFKAVGQSEAPSHEGCDYVVCFCPVASRVGIDVSEALNKTPAGKPIILVVMHHTFDPDHVVAESRRHVTNTKVVLTVDCLFYEHNLLTCQRNHAAWDEVQKTLDHRRRHHQSSSSLSCDKDDGFVVVEPLLRSSAAEVVGDGDDAVQSRVEDGSSLSVDTSKAQDNTPGKKFFVFLAGKTNDAHHDFVKKFKAVGQSEAPSHEGCDYVVCFCPVASRVGTDVSEALNKTPAGKPIILVVMHHTFDPDHVVAESRRHVTNTKVVLTVDCLFYEHNLLTCQCNHAAWNEVQKYLSQAINIKMSSLDTFFVLPMKTAGDKEKKAHQNFVVKLKDFGLTEVSNSEETGHLLIFCYVTSQDHRDLIQAVNEMTIDKPTILVVMHDTSNPDHVVTQSRTLVNNTHLKLTVDCLFYEDRFLDCQHNKAAWDEVQKYLSQVSNIKTREISPLWDKSII